MRETKCRNCGGKGGRKAPWRGWQECTVCLGTGKCIQADYRTGPIK